MSEQACASRWLAVAAVPGRGSCLKLRRALGVHGKHCAKPWLIRRTSRTTPCESRAKPSREPEPPQRLAARPLLAALGQPPGPGLTTKTLREPALAVLAPPTEPGQTLREPARQARLPEGRREQCVEPRRPQAEPWPSPCPSQWPSTVLFWPVGRSGPQARSASFPAASP